MSDLLKQAIADAKAVRATALSNAKAALEEHFAPKLQSMLSEKLKAELDEEGAAEEVPAAPAPEAHADAAQDAAMMAGGSPEGHADAAADAAMAPAPAAETPAPAPAEEAPEEEPAPVAEEQELDLEGLMEEEIDEDTNSYPGTHAGPGVPGYNLEEAKKASSNYKTKTKGHKTDNKGQEVVDATKLDTKGSLKAAASNRTASPDYTKTTAGHKTEDPQGQGNELSNGGYDNDTAPLKESDEIEEGTLDEILKELEDGLNEVGMDSLAEAPAGEEVDEAACATEEMDEVINLDELLSETADEDADDKKEVDEGIEDLKKWQEKHGKKDDDKEEDKTVKENLSLKKELAEYRSAVVYLRDRINEVNLLNAKLLYTNKLFKQASLNNEQKLKVIESFDLTKSVREAKLVYATLAESFSFGGKKTVQAAAPEKKQVSGTVKSITEGLASKPVASTKPTKAAVLTEGAEMANRFKKLAGIRS